MKILVILQRKHKREDENGVQRFTFNKLDGILVCYVQRFMRNLFKGLCARRVGARQRQSKF